MKTISLLYHDVVLPGHSEASGFAGADAAIYKLDLPEFQEHIRAISSATSTAPTTVRDVGTRGHYPFLLTFDDGGCSAHEYVADFLDSFQWRAHFFITTDWIGRHGFLSLAQIRDLHARGHVIGSHSCTHPPRMSCCSREQLSREWKDSIATLSDILGENVDTASVPGGYHSRKVAEEAAKAGIRVLFTSEPHTRPQFVNGCMVLGRYTIQRGIKAGTAASIATRRILPRYSQFAYWNAKKIAKAIGGNLWLEARRWILAR